MPINLSPFRFVDDFSFPPKEKYWRVDYNWTTYDQEARSVYEGNFWRNNEPYYPTYYGNVGVHKEHDPDDIFYPGPNYIATNWPEAWIARVPYEFKDPEKATYTKEIWIEQQYSRFFGFVVYDPSYPWTMGFWEFGAHLPAKAAETEDDQKFFFTSSVDEEANLPNVIEEWWTLFKTSYKPGMESYSKGEHYRVTKEEYEAG